MAGPQNGFSSGKQIVTIYAPDGTASQHTRPNAIDLVRRSGYSWNVEDAGKARVESEGPEDPSADIVAIYDREGNEHQVTRRNAREMVARGDYTWTLNGMTEAEAAQAVVEAADALAAAEEALAAESDEDEESEDEAPADESLTEEAIRVTGKEDVAEYLQGFSLDALKQIANERYGETIHHRASKETAIAKIVELEEAHQLA